MTDSEESEYRTKGKSKKISLASITSLTSLTSFMVAFYIPISASIWAYNLGASDSYFREILPNIHEDSIHSMIFEISLYYILFLFIIFWIQFLMIFALRSSEKIEKFTKLTIDRGKMRPINHPLEIISIFICILTFLLSIAIHPTLQRFFFADVREGFDIVCILFITIIVIAIASYFALRGVRNQLLNLESLPSKKQLFTIALLASLIVSSIFGLFASSRHYKKGYGLSCDYLSSIQKYKKDGEEYIFSNQKNIGLINPKTFEKEEYKKNKIATLSDEQFNLPINGKNPIRIKFLQLKEEGENIRILITDVRRFYNSDSSDSPDDKTNRISYLNLLSEPVIVTVPKGDLIGKGNKENGVENLCKNGRTVNLNT